VRPLPERRVARLLREAALGLAYSHSKQCLHRDVKLENLFFGQDGKVRVGDFGLAKRLQRGPVTRLSAAGTAPYKSPEQLLGQPRDGRAADVYALGVCAHELLTLRFVWESWPPPEVLEHETKRRMSESRKRTGTGTGMGKGKGKGRRSLARAGCRTDPLPANDDDDDDDDDDEDGNGGESAGEEENEDKDKEIDSSSSSSDTLGDMEGTLAARLLHRPVEALDMFMQRVNRRWDGLVPRRHCAVSDENRDADEGSKACHHGGADAGCDECECDGGEGPGPYSHRLLRLVRAMLDPEPKRRPAAEEAASRLLTIERIAARRDAESKQD